ncbi:MAG: recombinase family protein [Angelakisella sp.]|jgi:site-specific DNA recombinase|nr:recombinase family protein [Angelakisella sp.]
MTIATPTVIVIPAKARSAQSEIKRQLRVAAYCRVSTAEEEQQSSYEAQKSFYTNKIMGNPEWTMAGIFADEGITGTSARKRPEFLRMIRQCRQKKIDLILTKSISRFARNTVDCLKYIRLLKEQGIAVIFEKENINTLDSDSEILITMLGAFAQAESESISANVRWGKRQAMREGKAIMVYKYLYGYQKGEDGEPEVIPKQAEIIRNIYKRYIAGASLRQIKDWLESENILNVTGGTIWSIASIRSILTNEKYCGDVLLQKTFIADCISKKAVKNTGQLPMYLVQNHHKGIVDRRTYDTVQAEMVRRKAEKSPTKAASTGLTSYASKYALTERLICGECGTRYRRCTWKRNGVTRIVWRCVSRLDYGTRYCHHSPTLEEGSLQRAILAAVNKGMSQKDSLIHEISNAMEQEVIPFPGEGISLAGIEIRLGEIDQQVGKLVALAASENDMQKYQEQLKGLLDEVTALKEKRTFIQEQREKNAGAFLRIENAVTALEQAPVEIAEWEESTIRQLVDMVKVVSKEKIIVCLRGGVQIEQEISE